MQQIHAITYTLRDLLSGKKYGIDFYQREYKWQLKQISELLTDLTDAFLDYYQPQHSVAEFGAYGHYFLGPIMVSQQDNERLIVDGQQRMSSLTLLLIYLHHQQAKRQDAVLISDLIYSTTSMVRSFNLQIPDRNACMEALFSGQPYDTSGQSESVKHLVDRYSDIETLFPHEAIDARALPYFVSWLIEKVHVICITTYAGTDVYKIFESMNDRGLSLSNTDMLKGYVLANISAQPQREQADATFKQCLIAFAEYDVLKKTKETAADFFKTWLRAQYAQDIRKTEKGAKPEDFDLIGTEYHRWVKANEQAIGLNTPEAFSQWVSTHLRFYARIYLDLMKASDSVLPGLETVYYNADHGFTQQYQVLLAPLLPSDDAATIAAKLKLTADYLDCWINRRLWNSRAMGYSTMKHAVFSLTKAVRGLSLPDLQQTLQARLAADELELPLTEQPELINWNAKSLHRILARFCDWTERASGEPGRYAAYTTKSSNPYEIEHLWANHHERHASEFEHAGEFAKYRNRLGGLVLLPKKINASLNDKDFASKVAHYQKENLLAKSLHEVCYTHNPGFLQMLAKTGIPFKPYTVFTKASFDERFAVYRGIAQALWSTKRLKDA